MGDTIRISSVFPKILQDRVNPTLIIDYSNSLGIGGNIIVYILDSVLHQVIEAVNDFDFKISIGAIQNSAQPLRVKDIFYNEMPSTYSFSLNIITKQKGICALYISDLYSKDLQGKDCTNAGFSIHLTI
jgi:hypothetical protein